MCVSTCCLHACGCRKIGNKILKDFVYDIILIEIKEHFHEIGPREICTVAGPYDMARLDGIL
jgi:hypothetical protein